MRESRSYGSVRGVAGDRYPYRDWEGPNLAGRQDGSITNALGHNIHCLCNRTLGMKSRNQLAITLTNTYRQERPGPARPPLLPGHATTLPD